MAKQRKKHVRRRDQQRKICGAKTQKGTGPPCSRPPGWGTEHPGYGSCKFHGGSTSNAGVAAARAEAREFGRPIPVTPTQAIRAVLHATAGDLAYAQAKLLEVSENGILDEKGRPHVWYRLRENKLLQVAKVAKMATDMGVSERMANLAAEQTAMMGEFLEEVVEAVGLTKEQRKLLGPAIREALPTIEGEAEER
jgi:hypothetical protein